MVKIRYLAIDDHKMWDEFRRGSEDAFSQIYHRYSVLLYQYGFRFTLKQSLIEDAIQDLFIDLMKNRNTIGSTDNVKLYLLKSFRRKLLRLLKKESRYAGDFIPEVSFGIHLSREDELINDESHGKKVFRLNQAIEKLSPRQKEAIYLRFKKELDYDEISQILEMSIEACRNLIYRSVKAIREAIDSENSSASFLFILRKFKKI